MNLVILAVVVLAIVAWILYFHWRKSILPCLALRLRGIIFWWIRLTFRVKNYFRESQSSANIHTIPNLVLSLTSTPQRIKLLSKTLANLAPQAEEVHLNLPRYFRNDEKQGYNESDILELQSKYANLKVFWSETDIGPALKVVPTFERLMHSNKLVLTVDDDVTLPTDLPTLYLEAFHESQSVITQIGPEKTFNNQTFKQVFGNRGVLYSMSLISESFLSTLKQYIALPHCKMHDDMSIGMALKKHGVGIHTIIMKNGGSDLEHGASEESISFLQIERLHLRDEQCIQAVVATV